MFVLANSITVHDLEKNRYKENYSNVQLKRELEMI